MKALLLTLAAVGVLAVNASAIVRTTQISLNEIAPAQATYDTTITVGAGGDSVFFGWVASWITFETSGADITVKPVIDYVLVSLGKEVAAASDVLTYGRREGLQKHSSQAFTLSDGSAAAYTATWSGIYITGTGASVHIKAGGNP